MNWKLEYKPLLWIVLIFATCYYLPIGMPRFDNAITESLHLVRWYAREHVILCLIPAFFIAGAIAAFINQAAVLKYLGADANKTVAYGVASISGSVLAVCSCTILPLFTGIYRMGAGLGPASAFLYAGPAINVLAIILTARILGPQLGIARAILAVVFAIIIGLIMHSIYRHEEMAKAKNQAMIPESEPTHSLWITGIYFAAMIAILVFANWGKPEVTSGIWFQIYSYKWVLTSSAAIAFGIILMTWYKLPKLHIFIGSLPVIVTSLFLSEDPRIPFVIGAIALAIILSRRDDEAGTWLKESWGFAKQILPLLLFGVLIAGLLLGRPGNEGLIPSEWVNRAVGGNSLMANFAASFAGAFMYFATLTEVPILQGLIGNGMGKGPALALLLAGPALSLPNMLVIRSVIGTQKTVIFVSLVIIMATFSGYMFGLFF
jgi:uncharacterized membrane protein YraQ (UPF0718 family)